MNTLILLAGLPGSGKTTICRRMHELGWATRVDVDHHKRIRADPKRVTDEVDPPEVRSLYCQDALKEALYKFDNGASIVIMDEVYPYHSVRSQMEAFCAEQKVDVQWVEVRSAPETAVARLSAPREGHLLHTPEIATKIHNMCAEAFEEFPEGTKNHTVVYNEDGSSIDSLVVEVLRLAKG